MAIGRNDHLILQCPVYVLLGKISMKLTPGVVKLFIVFKNNIKKIPYSFDSDLSSQNNPDCSYLRAPGYTGHQGTVIEPSEITSRIFFLRILRITLYGQMSKVETILLQLKSLQGFSD